MRYVVMVINILVIISFTGCMMMGGMLHKMDDDGHKEMSEKLIKEVEINDYRITAEFPTLTYDKEAVFRLKIYLIKDSIASSASVRLMISEAVHERHTDEDQFYRDLNKDSDGNYSEIYFVKTTKNLKISYIITELEDLVFKKPIEIGAERSVHIPQKQNGMWMHDIGPYAIIGGVVMLTIMVFMMGRFL